MVFDDEQNLVPVTLNAIINYNYNYKLRLVFGGVRFAGWSTTTVVLQTAKRTPPNISRNKSSNTQRTENKTTDVVINQQSRRLLKMDILISETCWAHNTWNNVASDIKLVFLSSTFVIYLTYLYTTHKLSCLVICSMFGVGNIYQQQQQMVKRNGNGRCASVNYAVFAIFVLQNL